VTIVLAHGGTGGAVAEAVFLGLPVVIFVVLSRWSKRKAAALEAQGEGAPADRAHGDGARNEGKEGS
jgi:hypothetical protein